MCRVHGGKKRALDPLELELPLFVSSLVGSGNRTSVLSQRPERSLQPLVLSFGSVASAGLHPQALQSSCNILFAAGRQAAKPRS